MTSTTTTPAAATYLRCRYRRVNAASFDRPDSAWGALHGSGGRRATLANKEPEGRTGRFFSSWPSRAEATTGGRGRLEGGVFCAWSNSSSVTLARRAVGCGMAGTCVPGTATARTADGRFSGLVVGALSNSVSTAGVACPALTGVTPGKAGPLCRGTDDEEPPAVTNWAPGPGPGGRALGSDPGIGGGTALGPEPGISRGAALGADPGIGGGTALGPDPGAGCDNLRPEPGCGSFGPEPELPVAKGFGLEPGAGTPDEGAERGADEEPARGAGVGASAGGPSGDRFRSLISWAIIATSLGRFQPSMPSFQTRTDCSGLSDTMIFAASLRPSGPCSLPSTATNHSR